MKVKTFEAQTMQEAIAMVKREMGVEAIILSAKDNSYGLVGSNSVVVTAALSEAAERKKKYAESKLTHESLIHYQNSSAKAQKDFINKSLENYNQNKKQAQQKYRSRSKNKYMDMTEEDQDNGLMAKPQQVVPSRAKDAYVVMAKNAREAATQPPVQPSSEVLELKSELAQLKEIIQSFKTMPQTMIPTPPVRVNENEAELVRAGVLEAYVRDMVNKAQDELDADTFRNKSLLDAWLVKEMMNRIEIQSKRTSDRYHVFVGATGQGKTSSLVKFATDLVIKEKKKIAIVNLDSQKLGASEQLRIYSQILNVPFVTINDLGDWDAIRDDLESFDHVLVDFPGLKLNSQDEVEFLRSMLPRGTGGRSIHYVQSAQARTEDMFDLASRYLQIGFDDFIFTGLDGGVQYGIIFNAYQRFRKPLHSFGIGPNLPEDLEPATKERVVDLIFKLSKKSETQRSETWA